MSSADQVTIMSARGGPGGAGGGLEVTSTASAAARVILQSTSQPPQNVAYKMQQDPPPLTSIVLSTSAASKMLAHSSPLATHQQQNAVPELHGATKHRVKQLLETYSMTAEKSLMGPEECQTYAKFDHPSYSGNILP